MAGESSVTKATTAKLANVRYGLYGQPGPYAGKSVAEVRSEVGTLWNIPPDAAAFKGKDRLADDYVIQPGDQVEFHKFLWLRRVISFENRVNSRKPYVGIAAHMATLSQAGSTLPEGATTTGGV